MREKCTINTNECEERQASTAMTSDLLCTFVVVEKIEEGELVRFLSVSVRGGGRTMEVPIPRNFAQFGRLG